MNNLVSSCLTAFALGVAVCVASPQADAQVVLLSESFQSTPTNWTRHNTTYNTIQSWGNAGAPAFGLRGERTAANSMNLLQAIYNGADNQFADFSGSVLLRSTAGGDNTGVMLAPKAPEGRVFKATTSI